MGGAGTGDGETCRARGAGLAGAPFASRHPVNDCPSPRGPVTGVVTGKSGYAQSGEVRSGTNPFLLSEQEKCVVLLNIALGAGSLFWPPAILRTLSAAGYRVVRYDQRGTGASSWKRTGAESMHTR